MSKLTEQQRRAVESIDSNVLVSAGAGSGKTHVLVERYVEILRRSPALSACDLIAVTYTKKAAREMRMRVKLKMDDLVRETSSDEDKERWKRLRQEVDNARIGTIHSLCESLLKTFPAEAGVDPQFQVLDDLEAAELLDASIEEALLGGAGSAAHLELLLSYPVDTIKEWVRQLVRGLPQFDAARQLLPAYSDEALAAHVEGLLVGLWRPAVEEIFEPAFWDPLLEAVGSGVLADGNKLVYVRRQVLELADAAKRLAACDADLKDCIACLRSLSEAIDLRLGGRDEASKAVRSALRAIRDRVDGALKNVPDCLVESDLVAFSHIRALIAVSQRAIGFCNQAKHQAQKLDFNDLILRSYELLSRPESAARSYYSTHTAAVLVDEFQDTNSVQAELLAMLAGPSTRLFLIGDDKQSIYKFQGADVSTFNTWKDQFQAGSFDMYGAGNADRPGARCAVERLDVSFRSHQSIVRFVNCVFENLLDGAGAGTQPYEARHQALQAERAASSDDESRVEVVIFDGAEDADKSSQGSRLLEARAVANWIRAKVAQKAPVEEKNGVVRPIEFGDFAILVQRNSDFKAIERELSLAGISYVAAGGVGFLERQEVYDIENLLRFLSCPADGHALLGVLRSPMFAVSDDVLHRLANTRLWSAVQRAAEEPGYIFLRPIVSALRKFLALAGRVSLPELLRSIIRDTGYEIAMVAVPNSHSRARNLWKLVSMASERAHMRPAEFADCLESMRRLRVKQTLAPVDSGNSVKLMTIHGSKGLEFPAVIVPVMGVEATRVPGKLRCHKDYGIALDCTRTGEEKPAFFRAARALETKMAAAEGKRLFYVAMTRARDYLAMFVDKNAREVPSFRNWLDDVLELDLSGEGVQPGFKLLKGMTGDAGYMVVHVDRESVPPDRDDNGGESAPVEGHTCVRTDLIDPIEPAMLEARDAWQEVSRVTPARGPAQLPQALVGRFFHASMERFCQRLEVLPRAILEDVALSETIAVVHPDTVRVLVDRGEQLLETFYASPLYELMRSSQAVFSEPPYVLLAPDRARVSRRPDLLLQDADGNWHVIDFKTDHFSPDQIEHQAKSHRRQLETYAEDIKTLTGVVVSKSLYFAEHGILHYLNPEDN